MHCKAPRRKIATGSLFAMCSGVSYWGGLCERGADADDGLSEHLADLRTALAARREGSDDVRGPLARDREQEPARRLGLRQEPNEPRRQRGIDDQARAEQGVEMATIALHAAAEDA